MIRTVPRFGYAFVRRRRCSAPSGPGRPAAFKLIWADRAIPLREGENMSRQRSPTERCGSTMHSVSRRHARILVIGEIGRRLEDLGQQERNVPGG